MRKLVAIVPLIAVLAGALVIYMTGIFVRWSDAYVVLEAGEVIAPPRAGDDERVRLANAMAEGEAPRGMPIGKRLHRMGTLAHLRYENVGADGRIVSTTEVRALVPSLPAFGVDAPGGILGRIECPQQCAQALAETGGAMLERGGTPGIATEWVMRMPVGTPYDLGLTSFTLQDIQDARPISLPQARYRVTLLEACQGRVRVGAVTSLEFHESAMLPIPKGLRTRQWVQLDGCPALTRRVPSRPEVVAAPAVSARTPSYAYRPPKLALLISQRGAVGRASLIVDEGAKLTLPETIHVHFRRACRFEAGTNRWVALPIPASALEVSGPGLMGRTRVALHFPEDPGLYWAQWTEVPANDTGAAREFALVVPAGRSVHCREGLLLAPGADEISLCVPGHGAAQPRVVPDPAQACPGGEAVRVSR